MKDFGKYTITRRQFAKATAAASFAILSAKAGAAQKNGDTLKVGLLGCGSRGTGAAINMLEGENNVQLIAMADLFQDRLDSSRESIKTHKNPVVAGKYAVNDDMCFTGFDAYKKILATDIDIIIEGSLPYSRPTHIEAAVEAKKHIFTEKPVASDVFGIKKVMEAAKKHKEMGLSFVAGTQRRHQAEYIEEIKKIQDGQYGEILAMRAYWCGGLPFAHERKPEWSDLETRIRNWYAFCWVAGDNIVEQHVHNLDVCNWVMGGPPKRVFASGGRAWKPATELYGDIYDNFSCDYEYANGVRMFSFSRHWNNVYGSVCEEVIGTKGKSNCRAKGVDGRDPYVQEHMDLVRSITGEGPYVHEGQQVADSTLTAIMGRTAAYTGNIQTYERILETNEKLTPDVYDFSLPYPVGPIPHPGAA